MCFKQQDKCRRTKTCCDEPECRARWRAEEQRLTNEAVTQYGRLVSEYRADITAGPPPTLH